jgi:hypothetical protein
MLNEASLGLELFGPMAKALRDLAHHRALSRIEHVYPPCTLRSSIVGILSILVHRRINNLRPFNTRRCFESRRPRHSF